MREAVQADNLRVLVLQGALSNTPIFPKPASNLPTAANPHSEENSEGEQLNTPWVTATLSHSPVLNISAGN